MGSHGVVGAKDDTIQGWAWLDRITAIPESLVEMMSVPALPDLGARLSASCRRVHPSLFRRGAA